MDPLISIITVVYNGEKTIEQTIKSVLNQSYDRIEYIIIDGLSTDGTIDIIKKYETEISMWLSEADKGLYDAMNKGVGMANGELIGIINSDDWYEKDAVSQIVDSYKRYPNKRIFHGDLVEIVDDKPKRYKGFNSSKFKFIYYAMTYNHPTMFIHKDVYNRHSYNTKFRSHADYQFILNILREDDSQFYYLPRHISNFRIGGISSEGSLLYGLTQGAEIRKSVGMNYFQISTAFFIGFITYYVNQIKRHFKNG